MVRIKHFVRWGPLCMGTLLLAACPADGTGDTGQDPGSSSEQPDSESDTPTDDTPTGEGPTSEPPTTDPPTSEPPTTTESATGEPVNPSTGGTESGDDSTSTSAGSTDGETGDTDASGGTTDATSDTSTGEPASPGESITQIVNAGRTASSTNFRMVFTLGQPTQHQWTHQSKNFRLQGGLSGANGDTP